MLESSWHVLSNPLQSWQTQMVVRKHVSATVHGTALAYDVVIRCFLGSTGVLRVMPAKTYK